MSQHIKLVKDNFVQEGLPKPKTFADYIGQDRAKDYVLRMIEGAKRIGKPLPHLIVLGPSGCGKTAFAECISTELSSKVHMIIASEELCRNDLCFAFEQVKRGDILYLDEAHSLPRPCQEMLYGYFDRGTVPRSGETSPDSEIEQVIPPITLVLSTNHPGLMRKELLNRLLRVELDEYSISEIKQLVVQASRGTAISDDAVEKLAAASHGIPRGALMMLKELSFLSDANRIITHDDVVRLYNVKKFGPDGLHHYHCKVLKFLFTQPNETARLGILSDKLGLDGAFIRKEVEPVIIGKGLLTVTPMGRKLTRKGREFIVVNAGGVTNGK